MRFRALLLAAALCLAQPAAAAIGTPTGIGSASSATGLATTLTITTTANAPAGCLIFVGLMGESNIVSSPSATDSALNTYAFVIGPSWANGFVFGFYAKNPAFLASGSTITLTYGGTAKAAISAVSVCGVDTTAPLDLNSAGTSGTGTGSTYTSATLAQANEIAFSINGLDQAPTGFTPNGAWTALPSPTQGANSTLLWSYQIVSSTAALTASPTWTSTRAWGQSIYTFKAAAGGGPTCRGALQLLGVGGC